jgi:hypothetical protein
MNAMRDTGLNGWGVRTSSDALLRGLRLAAVALGIGFVMTAGIARAQDAEDAEDNMSFEDKIIKGIMAGVGGTNMDNQGIDYRERSPLVVPPKIDLPPPDTAAPARQANWPRDPDVAQRKASAAAARSGRPEEVLEAARPLTPTEMAPKRVRATASGNASAPGSPADPNKNIVLSPSQLGYEGGLFKNMFGGNKGETAKFTGEPVRGELTQPPAGYQTPSPNYAYGTGPKDVMKNDADINPMTGTNPNASKQ